MEVVVCLQRLCLICFDRIGCRLRNIVKRLKRDDVRRDDLMKNLEYICKVLDVGRASSGLCDCVCLCVVIS